MKILMADGHQVFSGTPVQIVIKMRNLSNRWKVSPLNTNEEYMDSIVQRAKELREGGVTLDITYSGTTEEEKCSSFVQSLISSGQAKEISE